MKFFILIFLFKIVIDLIECQTNPTSNSTEANLIKSASSIRTYNQSCKGDYYCINNLECKNLKCKCPSGKIWSNSTNNCLAFSQQSCNHSIQCQDSDPNMVCSDHKCQCQSGYQIVGKKCYQNSYISNHYGVCSYNYVCNTTLECINNYCHCPVGTIWSSELVQCISMSLGYCKSNYDCQDQDIHMKCSYSGKCKCEDGYELNSFTKLCKKKKITVGSSCSYSYQCQLDDLNMVCSSYGQCKCSDGYEFDYYIKLCKKKKKVIGSSCTYDYECDYLNSYCNYGSCSCKNGYTESISTCIKDYKVDLYNYSYLNYLWMLVIIPFIALFIRFCINYSHLSRRTPQVHVINTPANNFNTISSGVPFVYNNPNPSSSIVQLSCTQPPFDSPPKYEEVASMNQQRNN